MMSQILRPAHAGGSRSRFLDHVSGAAQRITAAYKQVSAHFARGRA